MNYYISEVVTHEISHAQFFNNKAYRDAVVQYWNEKLTEKERKKIRFALKSDSIGYNDKDEYLMINEFQAYLTSLNIHFSSILEEFHDPHYALLKAHLLSKTGARLLTVPHPNDVKDFSMCNKYLIIDTK